jgi:hypothetical protein
MNYATDEKKVGWQGWHALPAYHNARVPMPERTQGRKAYDIRRIQESTR